MLEVHAILHRQRCYENMTEKTGTLSDAYEKTVVGGYYNQDIGKELSENHL